MPQFPNNDEENRWLAHAKKLRKRAYEYELRALRSWQKRLGQKVRRDEMLKLRDQQQGLS